QGRGRGVRPRRGQALRPELEGDARGGQRSGLSGPHPTRRPGHARARPGGLVRVSRWAPSVTWSLALGLGALALDRLHKLLQLDVIGWHGGETVTLTPFFDYVLVWNTGISYGLLGGLPAEGLLAIMVAAMALLVIWWWRDKSFLTRIG